MLGKRDSLIWNNNEGKTILHDYVANLRAAGWTDKQIEADLRDEVMRQINKSTNWTSTPLLVA